MPDWFAPSRPDEIQPVPWLAPDVVEYLEEIVQPDFKVLEFGAGGSTLWFAERVKQVVSIEHDPDWQRVVQKNLTNGNRVLSQLNEMDFFSDRADLLLIDGEPIEERAYWIIGSPTLVKQGGWVVLDNANRPEYAEERETLKRHSKLIKTFDGNTQTGFKYLVTEFWRCE